MISKLKEIYPSIISFDATKSEHFQWYLSETGDIFGIRHDELTEKDRKLLGTIFTTYKPNLPSRSPLEDLWYERIFHAGDETPPYPFRLIYFEMQKNQLDPANFREALTTLFKHEIPILWEDETSGIIIEELKPTEETIHFEQIINILMADLSVNIRFFIGLKLQGTEKVEDTYDHLIDVGANIFSQTKQKVIQYTEAIPYLFVQQLPKKEKDKLTTAILMTFRHDQEMLETLHMYLKHNLNISETAKHMYMHRNSVQYRIDKFTTETGISVQSFHDAVTVKLALLAKQGLID